MVTFQLNQLNLYHSSENIVTPMHHHNSSFIYEERSHHLFECIVWNILQFYILLMHSKIWIATFTLQEDKNRTRYRVWVCSIASLYMPLPSDKNQIFKHLIRFTSFLINFKIHACRNASLAATKFSRVIYVVCKVTLCYIILS